MRELEQRLVVLGQALDVPDVPDFAPGVLTRIAEPRPSPRRRRLALALALVAVAALLAALAIPAQILPAPALAQGKAARDNIDALIEEQARAAGVPASFVHAVVKRESNYNPKAKGGSALGLMQIKHATARSLGYTGDAAGLYDPATNAFTAVGSLAGAGAVRDSAKLREWRGRVGRRGGKDGEAEASGSCGAAASGSVCRPCATITMLPQASASRSRGTRC